MSASQKNKTTAPVTPQATTAKSASAAKPSSSKSKATQTTHLFLFDKTNYYIMFAGIGLIVLGFILMAGGKSADPHVFLKDEIYSFRRITLAPFLVIMGFVVEIFAIMKKPKPQA